MSEDIFQNAVVSEDSLTVLGIPPSGVSVAAVLTSRYLDAALLGRFLVLNQGAATTKPFGVIYDHNLTVAGVTEFPSSTFVRVAAGCNEEIFAALGETDERDFGLWLINPADGATFWVFLLSNTFVWTGAFALSMPGFSGIYCGAGDGTIRFLKAVSDYAPVFATAAIAGEVVQSGGLLCVPKPEVETPPGLKYVLAIWQATGDDPVEPGGTVTMTLRRYDAFGELEASVVVGTRVQTNPAVPVISTVMLAPDGLHVWVATQGVPVAQYRISDLALITTLENSFYAFSGFVAPRDYALGG